MGTEQQKVGEYRQMPLFAEEASHVMSIDWFGKQGLVSLEAGYLKIRSNENRRGTEQVCPVV